MLQNIASLLGAIKGSSLKQKYSINFPYNSAFTPVLTFLMSHHLIKGFSIEFIHTKYFFRIYLLYNKAGRSLIKDVKMFSTKHFNFCCTVAFLQKLCLTNNFRYRHLNLIYLIYTKKGLLTIQEALKQNLGGQLVCSIQLY